MASLHIFILTTDNMKGVKGLCSIFLWCVYLLCVSSVSSADTRHVYLQLGKPGIVQCPQVAANTVNVQEITSAYWYKVLPEEEDLLSENFEGIINSASRYNITGDFSLAVDDVALMDGGTYKCTVIESKQIRRGQVNVTISIAPSEPAPRIDECSVSDGRDYCLIQLAPEQTGYGVTCRMTNARPQVDLHLLRVYADGSSEAVDQVKHSVRRDRLGGARGRGESLYSTTLFFKETSNKSGNTTLLCIATGIAMGDNNGSSIEVRIFKVPPNDVHVHTTSAGWSTKDENIANGLGGTSIAVICVLCVLGVLLVVAAVLLLKKHVCKRACNPTAASEAFLNMKEFPQTNQLKTHYKNEMTS